MGCTELRNRAHKLRWSRNGRLGPPLFDVDSVHLYGAGNSHRKLLVQ